MRIMLRAEGLVLIESSFDVPLPPSWVWNEMRDLAHFATADPFHGEIEIDGGVPRQGASIRVHHSYAGVRIVRVGRILIWRPGECFAFSDLSARDPRRAFPHIFRFTMQRLDAASTRVTIAVHGKWTLHRLPLTIRRLWLWWVMRMTTDAARNHLLRAVAVYRASPSFSSRTA